MSNFLKKGEIYDFLPNLDFYLVKEPTLNKNPCLAFILTYKENHQQFSFMVLEDPYESCQQDMFLFVIKALFQNKIGYFITEKKYKFEQIFSKIEEEE